MCILKDQSLSTLSQHTEYTHTITLLTQTKPLTRTTQNTQPEPQLVALLPHTLLDSTYTDHTKHQVLIAGLHQQDYR